MSISCSRFNLRALARNSAGANAGLFPMGITQLFRLEQRLPCGRWPNLDAGYAFVEDAPAGDQLTDVELPAANWSGAVLRIKTQRWLLVNRDVVSSSGATLNLKTPKPQNPVNLENLLL